MPDLHLHMYTGNSTHKCLSLYFFYDTGFYFIGIEGQSCRELLPSEELIASPGSPRQESKCYF